MSHHDIVGRSEFVKMSAGNTTGNTTVSRTADRFGDGGFIVRIGFAAIACALFCFSAPKAWATGSVTVFGNSDAQECYFQTKLPFGASSSTIDLCTKALKYGNLTRRDRAATLVNRGINFTNMRRFEEALADFKAALEIDGKLAEAFLNRGNTHIYQREFKKAVADYDRAIELGTRQDYAAHYNRGLAHEALRNLDAAYADYLKAVELNPEWELAQERVKTYQSRYLNQN